MEKKKSHAFGKDVYLLGLIDGKMQWLEAPSWDCGWYWGFGYVEEYTRHDKPSITLVRRPKKFETREIEFLGNVYGDCIYHYDSEEDCKKHESISCLNPDNKKIKITYMVEV